MQYFLLIIYYFPIFVNFSNSLFLKFVFLVKFSCIVQCESFVPMHFFGKRFFFQTLILNCSTSQVRYTVHYSESCTERIDSNSNMTAQIQTYVFIYSSFIS